MLNAPANNSLNNFHSQANPIFRLAAKRFKNSSCNRKNPLIGNEAIKDHCET